MQVAYLVAAVIAGLCLAGLIIDELDRRRTKRLYEADVEAAKQERFCKFCGE